MGLRAGTHSLELLFVDIACSFGKKKSQQKQSRMILLRETSRYSSAAYGASKIVIEKVGKSQAAFVLILWSFR